MRMGRRKRERQQELWVATASLPDVPQHVFYEKLNRLLEESDFDVFVEELCEPYDADNVGRNSIPPGRYFRMLLVGYFEGIDSQRGIAWRCADSRSLRSFLFLESHETSPDHSSLSRIQGGPPLFVQPPDEPLPAAVGRGVVPDDELKIGMIGPQQRLQRQPGGVQPVVGHQQHGHPLRAAAADPADRLQLPRSASLFPELEVVRTRAAQHVLVLSLLALVPLAPAGLAAFAVGRLHSFDSCGFDSASGGRPRSRRRCSNSAWMFSSGSMRIVRSWS